MEMSASDIDEIVTKRRDFLAVLCEDSATKPELVERLETSRSTVDRAIDDLSAYDLVRRPEDRYELTMAGKAAYERHREYLDELSAIERARDIISSLSPDVPFSHELLADAEIELAEPHDPHQPLELAAESMTGATRLWNLTPAIFPLCVEVLNERVADELSLELIVTSDVLEAFRERYADEVACFDDPEQQLYELDDEPPYALWIAERPDRTRVGLMPHTEAGVHGIIVTDDDDAHRWAREQYDRYRERATLVENFREQA